MRGSSLFLVLLVLSQARAETRASNPMCTSARIASLRFQEVGGALTENFCTLSTAASPRPAQAILAQALRLNQKAAELFQVPLEKLLPHPFELLIQKSPRGPLFSFVRTGSSGGVVTTTLHQGVFTDWNGEPINPGVYLHELGHVVAESSPNQNLPPIYNQLSSTPLVTEMVADLVALYGTGHIVSPEPGLPQCLQEFRRVAPRQSFESPADDFTYLSGWRGFRSCCKSLSEAAAHTRHSKEFCETEAAKRPVAPVRSFGSARFSVEFYAEQKHAVDPHLLGLPMNSFLSSLRRETGVDVPRRLIDAMGSASLEDKRPYVCSVPRLQSFLKPVYEKAYSFSQVLYRLRADFPASSRGVFERLWREHGLDTWVTLAELDSREYAGGNALHQGADEYNRLSNGEPSGSPDPKLRKTGCWHSSPPPYPGYLDDSLPGCVFECSPLETRPNWSP